MKEGKCFESILYIVNAIISFYNFLCNDNEDLEKVRSQNNASG